LLFYRVDFCNELGFDSYAKWLLFGLKQKKNRQKFASKERNA
jgi:hypothetical protein